VSLAAGAAGATAAALAGAGRATPLIGWDVLALVFGVWVWSTVWRLDAETTAGRARREDPSTDVADVVLLAAAIASLIAVGLVLAGAGKSTGLALYLQAGLALFSVFVSWALIHTVFTLKYARLYDAGDAGGISFSQTAAPDYGDFAYLAFTIGMTFQVSDTDIGSRQIRRTALRHAWLSFPMGAVIIAATINVVSGLAKSHGKARRPLPALGRRQATPLWPGRIREREATKSPRASACDRLREEAPPQQQVLRMLAITRLLDVFAVPEVSSSEPG
jgi:uncharacterized membrane protein